MQEKIGKRQIDLPKIFEKEYKKHQVYRTIRKVTQRYKKCIYI